VCSNYQPVTRKDRLLSFFGVERERDDESVDTWPTGMAPFIRLAEAGSGNRRVVHDGIFGLLPAFAKELAFGRRTYNARSETVHQLPSFRDSWRNGWRCIVPAEVIYEPYFAHDGAKAERWAIYQPGGLPMGIAGIYTKWTSPEGHELFSFAMLTVNADDHVFYQRFHRPGDEKRMPILLAPEDYDAWLACPVEDAAKFFRQWPGQLQAEAAPLPPRAPQASSVRTSRPKPTEKPKLAEKPQEPPKTTEPKKPQPPEQGSLF
jgi:putative SOS response-associated peptidase YedK